MDNKITIDIEAIRKMPNESVTDAETIRQISLWCIENRDVTLANKIDGRFTVAGLYPHIVESYHITPDTPIKMTKEHILSELDITDEVLAIFPYGSQVYGTANRESDHDFIIVMKRGILENGAFKNNAISNKDRTIQGVVYSRGGFINAINEYEIGALECLSLSDEDVIFKKWPFKIQNWNEKAMIKATISKASNSRHNADQQSKNGNKWVGKKSMYHALRILRFGLQLKKYQMIVNFSECNEMYAEMIQIEDREFDTRDYYEEFDELLNELRYE